MTAAERVTGGKFNNASMRACDLRGAIVQYGDLSGADLSQFPVDGAGFLYSEFVRPHHRCNLDGVTGINHALISPYELKEGLPCSGLSTPPRSGPKGRARRTGLNFTLNRCEIGSQFEQLIARRESLKYKNTVKPNGLRELNDWEVT